MPEDHTPYQRGFENQEQHDERVSAVEARPDAVDDTEPERADHGPMDLPTGGVDVRWVVALLAIGIALIAGSAMLFKSGWLAQGSGTYAVDSYGEVYSSTSGRTLDDIVYEDFLFSINPYLFALGLATVLGTFFIVAVKGVRRPSKRVPRELL